MPMYNQAYRSQSKPYLNLEFIGIDSKLVEETWIAVTLWLQF